MLGCALPKRVGLLPGVQIAGCDIGQKMQAAVEQRDVDRLSAAGPLAREQRGEDRLDGIRAGCEVDEGDAEPHRIAVGLARDRHEAGLGLHHEVIAGTICERRRAPVARDRAMNEPRVARAQAFIGEAKRLEAGGAEVLDEYVGLAGKLRQNGAPALSLEIDRDALLAAIDRQVIGGNSLDRGRHPGPGIVAAVGVLDLPDLGAEIRKRHGAPRPGEDPRKVQHLDAVERRCHRYLSPEASKPRVQ